MENIRMASSLANVKEPARPAVFLDTEDYERFGVFGKGARSDREKRLLEYLTLTRESKRRTTDDGWPDHGTADQPPLSSASAQAGPALATGAPNKSLLSVADHRRHVYLHRRFGPSLRQLEGAATVAVQGDPRRVEVEDLLRRVGAERQAFAEYCLSAEPPRGAARRFIDPPIWDNLKAQLADYRARQLQVLPRHYALLDSIVLARPRRGCNPKPNVHPIVSTVAPLPAADACQPRRLHHRILAAVKTPGAFSPGNPVAKVVYSDDAAAQSSADNDVPSFAVYLTPGKGLPAPERDGRFHVAASEQSADVVCSMAAIVGLFTEVVADCAQGMRVPFTVEQQPDSRTVVIHRPVPQQQTAADWNTHFLDQTLPAALTEALAPEGSGVNAGSGVGAACVWSLDSNDGGDAVKIAFRAEGLVATPARTTPLSITQASEARAAGLTDHLCGVAILVSKLECQATAGTEASTTREAAALWIRQHLCNASTVVIVHCVPEAGAIGIVRAQAVDQGHLQAQSSQFEPQRALQGLLTVMRRIAKLSEPGDYVMVHRAKQPGAFSLWKHDSSGGVAAGDHDLHACDGAETLLPHGGALRAVTRWNAAPDTIPGTFQPNESAVSGHCHQYRDHGNCAGPCPYPHFTMAEAVALGENTNQSLKNTKKKPKNVNKNRKNGKMRK